MAKHIFKGEGAPNFTPIQVGHHYVDTLNDRHYLSKGTASSADWQIVTETSDHGNLTGLADDDHVQYLLIDGTRAMSDALNMGTNNITNAGTVNGVSVTAHASRHLPSGADALTTAAPAADLTASTTNATGSANSLARSDHSHAITTAAPSTNLTATTSNALGSAATIARSDHSHAITTAAPSVNLTATGINAAGSAAGLARADHSHAISTGDASAQTPDQANATGSSANLARADHVHNIATAAAVTVGTNIANAQGAATTFARSNHTHAVTVYNDSALATADTTTTSGTDVLMNAMTLTPPSGTYVVLFSTTLASSSTGADLFINIYSGGTIVASSEKRCSPNFNSGGLGGTPNLDFPVATSAIVTVNGAQAIEGRWRRTAGTATARQRVLNIIKLS